MMESIRLMNSFMAVCRDSGPCGDDRGLRPAPDERKTGRPGRNRPWRFQNEME